MGNCVSKKQDPPEKFQTFIMDDDLPSVSFKICISKLIVRELIFSSAKSKKASVSLQLKEKTVVFNEIEMANEVLKWAESRHIVYESTLSSMNHDKIDISVVSNKKTICYCEISVKSIIDGPVYQNFALIHNGLIIGRISFEMEMLEVSNLSITPTEIKCSLGDENLGNFSFSLRFASDFTEESQQSEVTEIPNWNFTPTSENTPNLNLEVTMKSIRDAALQLRVYKHHKSEKEPELIAECWLSFNKLFAEDMEAIYRTESFLASRSKEEGTRLDFDKLIKSMKRIHHKKIDENLWRAGRKIGNINGLLKLSGIPTFVQLISGVNTEKGYSIQSNVYMTGVDNKGKEDLPKKILEVIKITNELEETIHYKPGKGGITYEKEMLKMKKDNFNKLFNILQSTQKDSMISFICKNQKSMVKCQEALLRLGNHLVEYAKLVNYDIKPSYFQCLTYLIKRGELDIGYLSKNATDESLILRKTNTAVEYLKFLHKVVELALSRMAFKGVDKITEEFVYTALAISWFRVPELREQLIKLIKEKSYYTVVEWRRTDIDLDDEKSNDISLVFDWKPFYEMIPENSVNFDSFGAILFQDAWRQKFIKRGMGFFRFFTHWISHVYTQTASQQVLWAGIFGYKILLKAFLIEMKEKPIVGYPEAMVDCAVILVHNAKLLNVMVRILFLKTNIYDFSSVQECYRLLDVLFSSVYKTNHALPPTFDAEFFFLGIQISLEDENALNVAKCLSFIYSQYHLLQGDLRIKIIYEIIVNKKLKKYFFHWCRDLRRTLHYLILFRILSIPEFSFEVPSHPEVDLQIAEAVQKKLRKFSEDSCRREQKPYFHASVEEFELVKKEYQDWAKVVPKETGKLFGFADIFPFPVVNIKFSFMDLAEKKIEELW